MIPFLDPLTGGAALLIAFSAKDLCHMPQPTKINIIPKTKAVQYDYSKSHAEIQNQNIDTINPYGYNSVTHTNGYMKGKIFLKSSVKLDYEALRRYDAHCVWYETVNVTIQIEPTIVIAAEVAADKCMLGAVRRHELKHVMVDRQIVNKYAKTIGKKVYDGLKQRGFIAGPIKNEYIESTIKRMRKTVNQLMELEYKKMEIERAERQQAVDNLGEYKSVQAKCPDFVPPGQGAAVTQKRR